MNLFSSLAPEGSAEGSAPLEMPTVYTVAPSSFMAFAADTASLATPDSKPLVEVGEPSVKKITIFLASSRLEVWLWASCKPLSARVAPAGLMELMVLVNAAASVQGDMAFITWL